MKNKDLKQLLMLALISGTLGLSACGDDDDDRYVPPATGGGGGGADEDLSTGVFVDSPVGGVNYSTDPGGHSGTTNGKGEYRYEEGDSVTFSIGGIQFPTVEAKGKVTPLDMGGEGADLTDDVVINVIRLLQTLDTDGDPENGISISEETRESLASVEITDFSEDFNTVAPDAIKDATGRDLVDDTEAMAHFENSLKSQLAGSWIYVEENDARNVLTFLVQEDQYLITHDSSDEEEQVAGSAEYANYTWDPVSGAFAVEVIAESDGSGGLSELGESDTFNLSVEGSTLTLDLGGGEVVEFTKVESADNPLVGAWFLRETGNFNVLTILDESNYVIAHTNNGEENQAGDIVAQSAEWGTYEWTESNGKLTINVPEVDLDGEGGLFHGHDGGAENYTLNAASTGDLDFASADDDERFSFFNLEAFPFTITEGDEDVAVVTRVDDVFEAGSGGTYGLDLGDEAFVLTLTEGGGSLNMGDETSDVISWQVTTSGTLVFEESFPGEDVSTKWRIAPILSKVGTAAIVSLEPIDEDPISMVIQIDEP